MMRLGESLCDGKTNPGITDALNKHIVRAIKTGKDTWKVFCWDAATAVRDLNEDEFRSFLGSGLDFEFGRAFERSCRPRILQIGE